jgi:hypothetical protein
MLRERGYAIARDLLVIDLLRVGQRSSGYRDTWTVGYLLLDGAARSMEVTCVGERPGRSREIYSRPRAYSREARIHRFAQLTNRGRSVRVNHVRRNEKHDFIALMRPLLVSEDLSDDGNVG